MRTIANSSKHRFSVRNIALMSLIITGPIQWIELADVGLSLRLVHIPFFLLSAIGFIDLVKGSVSTSKLRKIGAFSLLYIIYIAGMLAPSIAGSFSISSLIKVCTYAISAFGIYLACSKIRPDEMIRTLRNASIASVVLFVTVAAATLAARKVSLLDTVLFALGTGDAKALQFKIFFNLFNETTIRSESTVNVSLRNTLVGFFILTFSFSMSSATSERRSRISYFAAAASALVVLLSVSRSNVIVLILVCALGFIATSAKSVQKSTLTIVVVCAALVASTMFMDLSGISQIVSDRVASFGDDGRITMYSIALSEIDASAFFGHGIGYTVNINGKDLMVHNLFLASWIQGGLVSLAGALGFIFSIVFYFINRATAYWQEPSSLFFLGILTLPLFRSQISGDAGNFTLPEWTALAICAAYFYQKDSQKRYKQVQNARSSLNSTKSEIPAHATL